MKKVLMIIGGIVVGIIVLGIIIFSIVSLTSKKLVCKSSEGNITLMYTDDKITGYTARNITYDLDQGQETAQKLGIEEYLNQFSAWFSQNTTGTCERK